MATISENRTKMHEVNTVWIEIRQLMDRIPSLGQDARSRSTPKVVLCQEYLTALACRPRLRR